MTSKDEARIRALRDEAGQAGDVDMIGMCNDALAGDDTARTWIMAYLNDVAVEFTRDAL